MSKNPAMKGLLAVALACGFVPAAGAQSDVVAKVLAIRPKSDDAVYTTPAADEIAKCTVEIIKGPTGGSGYLLSDSSKRPLRKFLDTQAKGTVDTWIYYQDGAEVYRESIIGKEFSVRWIGQGGMKYGVGKYDSAAKPRIEMWRMISADEAAQEAFQALVTGDFERMKALFITPQEIQALGLPAAEAQKLMALQQNAQAKFQKVRTGLPTLPQATFSRLENAKPGAYPPDLTGGTQDIIKIPSGMILFENAVGPKKHDWIHSQEIVQVGNAWRLTDVPSPDAGGGVGGVVPPALVALLNQLKQIDDTPPQKGQLSAWTVQRVTVLQKIAENSKADEQEQWYKQIFDNLAQAIVDGDEKLLPMLTKWKTHFVTNAPTGSLAPYGAYREIWATYQLKFMKTQANQLAKVQVAYNEELAKFIQAYPKADDTPDALITIATNADFSGGDNEAKKLYGQIVANFPNSSNAAKAAGAIRRIDSVDQPFALTGPTLQNQAYTFAPGRITVVYYWASLSNQAIGEFVTLKKLQQTFGNLDIVCVNLDDKAVDAAAFLQKNPLAAPQLHQPGKDGGMNSPLAANYGIFGLPHAFLIDASGRVVNNRAQVNALEDEITKLTNKK